MTRLFLGLVIHNHQPVGNFPWVFQEAFDKAYEPFLSLLEAHPSVRVALHYSGPLVDWMLENQPGFFDRLAALVGRGQVEMVSGGYYEPIMPSIPAKDRLGQLEKMNRFLEERFGVRPTGAWVAERVWEPDLPKFYAQAGLRWVVLDDSHFLLAGLDESQLLGYYVTEDEGHMVKVFASLKDLRYSIPWREVDDVITWLKEHASDNGTTIAVMGDDGEKFGLWPETYKHCWSNGWMERFFGALEENSDWLLTIPVGEFAEAFPPLGTVYLPCASYPEMMTWSLPPESAYRFERLVKEAESTGRRDLLRYLHAGFWRNFNARYPEINALHKKMLYVHRKAHEAVRQGADKRVLEKLWEGQCNCPYWHGVFGGIYIPDIRSANYRCLIEAENMADAYVGSLPLARVEDYDCDGSAELILEGTGFNVYIKPRSGGGIVEWDIRGPAHNLAAALSRRPEAYHMAALEAVQSVPEGRALNIHEVLKLKEANLLSEIRYDAYPRICGVEHLLDPSLAPEDIEAGDLRNSITLATLPWEVVKVDVSPNPLARLEWRSHISVTKEFSINGGLLRVAYLLVNPGDDPVATRLASEWNLNLLAGGNPTAFGTIDGRRVRLDSRELFDHVPAFEMQNQSIGVDLEVRLSPPAQLWMMPLETVSSSEGGLERLYQATTLVAVWPVTLPPRGTVAVEVSWLTHSGDG